MYSMNDQDIFKEARQQLTRLIKEQKAWHLFYEQADENRMIEYSKFEIATRHLTLSISDREFDQLRKNLFPYGKITLDELALKLKISVLDQKLKQQKKGDVSKNDKSKSSLSHPRDRSEEQQKKTDASKKDQPSITQHSNQPEEQFQQEHLSEHDRSEMQQQHGGSQTGLPQRSQQSIPRSQNQIEQQQNAFQKINEEPYQEIESPRKLGQTLEREDKKSKVVNLDEQLEMLFDEIDDNKNGWLDPKELNKALLYLGINPDPQEMIAYFTTFDKNQDEKISLMEFKQIIKDQLMKGMFSGDDIAALIATEYQLFSDTNRYELDMPQLQQVFQKIGIKLGNNEILDLFEEIDLDKSGFIEQQELVNFLQKPFSTHSQRAQHLLGKLNKNSTLQLNELRDFFTQIPANFTHSFLLANNKKALNLPSEAWVPRLHSSGLFYRDLQLINAQKYKLTEPLIDYTQPRPQYLFEIHLISAVGIPSFDPEKMKKKPLLREVGICVFDRINQKFLGNTAYVTCAHEESNPDKWLFLSKNPIIFGCNLEKEQQLSLIIEFIVHVENKNSLFSLSVCYAEVSLNGLKEGKRTLPMKGGSPLNQLSIDPKTIQGKTSLFSTKATQPTIAIEFITITEKMDKQKLLVGLPYMYLLPSRWVQLIHDFRELVALESIKKGFFDSCLPNHQMRAFLDLLDLPECGDQVATWWNQKPQLKEHAKVVSVMGFLCQRSYLSVQRVDFNLKQYPKCQRLQHKYSLLEKRRSCLNEMLADVGQLVGIMSGGRRSESYFDMAPMILGGFGDEDNQMMKKLVRKFHRD